MTFSHMLWKTCSSSSNAKSSSLRLLWIHELHAHFPMSFPLALIPLATDGWFVMAGMVALCSPHVLGTF